MQLQSSGTQKNDRYRLKRIAREMSALTRHSALSGSDQRQGDTGNQRRDCGMDDAHDRLSLRTHFGYCHLFKEKYPEGVSVSSHYPLRNVQVLDLNKGLGRGLHP